MKAVDSETGDAAMSCPTCSHTMASINDRAAYLVFVCPRCGTVKTEAYTGDPTNWHIKVYTPKLVQACRDFIGDLRAEADPCALRLGRRWVNLGIMDAINTPGERVVP